MQVDVTSSILAVGPAGIVAVVAVIVAGCVVVLRKTAKAWGPGKAVLCSVVLLMVLSLAAIVAWRSAGRSGVLRHGMVWRPTNGSASWPVTEPARPVVRGMGWRPTDEAARAADSAVAEVRRAGQQVEAELARQAAELECMSKTTSGPPLEEADRVQEVRLTTTREEQGQAARGKKPANRRHVKLAIEEVFRNASRAVDNDFVRTLVLSQLPDAESEEPAGPSDDRPAAPAAAPEPPACVDRVEGVAAPACAAESSGEARGGGALARAGTRGPRTKVEIRDRNYRQTAFLSHLQTGGLLLVFLVLAYLFVVVGRRPHYGWILRVVTGATFIGGCVLLRVLHQLIHT